MLDPSLSEDFLELFCVAIIVTRLLAGSELEDKIQFAWMNQEDDAEV